MIDVSMVLFSKVTMRNLSYLKIQHIEQKEKAVERRGGRAARTAQRSGSTQIALWLVLN